MKKYSLLKRFLIWRVKHVTNYQFNMIMSVVIGLCVGIAAVIIKNSVHLIRELLENGIHKEYHNFLYFAYPLAGITLVVLFVKIFLKQRVGHGIPSVLYSISKDNGFIKPHNTFSSVITSALTVGFGGSVGLEGPTVSTGAAVGANISRVLHLSYKQRVLMLGCASAGAMAAIFKAPIAAIVFALEVIMLDLTMASLVPLLISSVTAALTSYLFLGKDVIYPFSLQDPFMIHDVPFYLLLGILSAFASVYFTKVYIYIHKIFEKIKKPYTRLLVGGISLGLLIFFIPSLYGEGYEAVNSCLHGDYSYLFNKSLFYDYRESIVVAGVLLIGIILFKVIATSVTFGSGGVGGIFAPTLFIGANLGLLFALVIKNLGISDLSFSNFALVGMAGTIAGVLHAPLTAIFLIAELTTGYELFMPLMLVSTISYVTTKFFIPNSVYTYQLAKRKELFTHHADKNILSMMRVEKLIETDFKTIEPDATLGDLVKTVSKSSRNLFPVIDNNHNFHGIITLDTIRHIMFKPELYNKIYVSDLMFMPEARVSSEDSMEDVATKFHNTGKYNLVVVNKTKYLGFVSRAKVFSSYRRMLKHFSEH